MQRILVLLPIAVVLVIGGFFVWGLNPERDPNAIPSVLISKPVPVFDLAPIAGVDVPGSISPPRPPHRSCADTRRRWWRRRCSLSRSWRLGCHRWRPC